MKRRLLACFIAMVMLASLIPLGAIAEDEPEQEIISEFQIGINPPCAGTYGMDEENFAEPEYDYSPSYIFGSSIEAAYVVEGEDEYGCPFADDGYTYFTGEFIQNEEYTVAVRISIDNTDNEIPYVFDEELVCYVNWEECEVQMADDHLSFTVYAHVAADVYHYVTLIDGFETDTDPETQEVYEYPVVIGELPVPSQEPFGNPSYDLSPIVPQKAGYNFTGWFADRNCTEPYEFGELLTEDLELYAGYDKKAVLNELNLTFAAPMAGDKVTVTEKELSVYDVYSFTANLPDRIPQLISEDESCKTEYSLFINSIPEDAVYGYVPDGDLFSGTFEAGNTYSLFFIIESDTVLFDEENFAVNIAGATVKKVFYSNDEDTGRSTAFVWATFTPASREGKTVISDITLTVVPPVAGESVFISDVYDEFFNFVRWEQWDTPNISYTLNDLGFMDQFRINVDKAEAYVLDNSYDYYGCPFSTYGYTFFEDEFERGEEYIAALQLVINPDEDDTYVFAAADDLTITVDGNDDKEITFTSDGHMLIVYIPVTAKNKNVIEYYKNIGEDADQYYSTDVFEGDVTTEPEYEFEEPGYKFIGWFEDEDCTVPFEFGHELTEDITLYAGWEELPVISELELNLTLPEAGQTVDWVPTEIEVIPGYTITTDYPTLLANVSSENDNVEIPYAYYLNRIPEDPEWGALEEDYFRGTFEKGETYAVEFAIGTDTAVFADPEDLTVSISGADSVVLDSNFSFGTDQIHVYASFHLHGGGDTRQENISDSNLTCGDIATYDEVEYCSVCGMELHRETVVADPLAHSMTRVKETANTCTEPGEIAHYDCLRCGKHFADATANVELTDSQLVIPAAHSPADPVDENVIEATCTVGSYKEAVVYCEVCGTVLSRDIITSDALGHDLDDGVVTKAPTCSETGVLTKSCSRCHYTESSVIPVNPDAHDWGEWTVVRAATTTVKGEKVCVCRNNVAHVKTEEIPLLEAVYMVTAGANTKYNVSGSAGKGAVLVSNAPFDLFERITVDGKVVDPANYTVEAVEDGKTKITLKEDFLKMLPSGDHEFSIVSENGEAKTTVSVETADTEKPAAADAASPNTADPNSYALWMAMIFVSACGIAAVEVRSRKENVYNG